MANPGAAPSHVRHRTRDALATHFLESGYGIRTVQGLPGHQDVKTTMIYTHVLNRWPRRPEPRGFSVSLSRGSYLDFNNR